MANVWLISAYLDGQFPATRYPGAFASVSLTHSLIDSKLIWLNHQLFDAGYTSDTLHYHDVHRMAVSRNRSHGFARIACFSASWAIPASQDVLLREFFHSGRHWRCACVLPGAGE